MTRKRLVLAILAAGVVVFAATAATLYARSRFSGQSADQGWVPLQVAAVCPASPSPVSPGGSAITPRNDCTPSFTEQDVRDYVSHLHELFKIGFVGQPTITHIWFITADDAAKLTHDASSNSGAPVVCYVELHGTFTVDAPPGMGPLPPDHTAFIIFDAHTGNMLGEGARR